jgi:hypothetical protein
VIPFQTCIGSAYSSVPVRWIETPEAARTQYALDKIAGKQVEKTVDPDVGKPRSMSGDVLDLSPETRKALKESQTDSRIRIKDYKSDTENAENKLESAAEKTLGASELTPEEKREVAELKARDMEVRAHEMAHVIAAGAHVTSGPSYEYKTGPDGKGYAVSGSVGIDTSPVAGDPEATIAKMQTIAAAAMAPASPSGQDHKVAAQARQAEARARVELSQVRIEEQAEEIQPESEEVAAFTLVRTADAVKTEDAATESPQKSDIAEDGIMSSLIRTHSKASEFAPSSAYKAQSSVAHTAPRFSAFA